MASRLGAALVPEDGQRDVLLPRTVLPHPDPKAGAEEQLARGHQVTLLGRLKLQHGAVPDEGVELAAGGGAWVSHPAFPPEAVRPRLCENAATS